MYIRTYLLYIYVLKTIQIFATHQQIDRGSYTTFNFRDNISILYRSCNINIVDFTILLKYVVALIQNHDC